MPISPPRENFYYVRRREQSFSDPGRGGFHVLPLVHHGGFSTCTSATSMAGDCSPKSGQVADRLAPASISQPGRVLGQSRQFLDYFWDIAKPDQAIRLKATEGLLNYLQENKKVRHCSCSWGVRADEGESFAPPPESLRVRPFPTIFRSEIFNLSGCTLDALRSTLVCVGFLAGNGKRAGSVRRNDLFC